MLKTLLGLHETLVKQTTWFDFIKGKLWSVVHTNYLFLSLIVICLRSTTRRTDIRFTCGIDRSDMLHELILLEIEIRIIQCFDVKFTLCIVSFTVCNIAFVLNLFRILTYRICSKFISIRLMFIICYQTFQTIRNCKSVNKIVNAFLFRLLSK